MSIIRAEGLDIFFLLLCVIVAFMAYWLTIEHRPLREAFSRRFGQADGSVRFFVFNKLWGVLWFGIVCTLVTSRLFPDMTLADFGLRIPATGSQARATWLWSLGLSLPLVLGNWLRSGRIARSSGDFGRYPEIQAPEWTPATLAITVGFWSLYLLAYELMFRGTLFFPLLRLLGFWPACGINIALYAAVHVPKGAGEAIGALFLGLVLCLITATTGSIATACIVHIALAVSNDVFAFIHHPGMQFQKRADKPRSGISRPAP